MDENKKMREAIHKTFEAMYGEAGELKSDFDKYTILKHALISNLGEFRDKPEPEIVPAEPLTEALKWGEAYFCVYVNGSIHSGSWSDHPFDHYQLFDNNVFPHTPEGKAGAELRAKVPHPGIHWQEDLKKLRDEMDIWTSVPYGNRESDARFGIKVQLFLNKYITE